MYNARAYAVSSATSPFAATTIARRDPTPHDVQIEILSVRKWRRLAREERRAS